MPTIFSVRKTVHRRIGQVPTIHTFYKYPKTEAFSMLKWLHPKGKGSLNLN